MNITELARILKITPQELREKLPLLGFDIGPKAIKIDRNVANKIIKDWPRLKKKLEYEERLRREEEEKRKREERRKKKEKIEIPKFITVRDFATLTNLPVNVILSELMKNGVFTSINEKIDFETAWLVGSELGFEVVLKEDVSAEEEQDIKKLKEILEKENKEKLQSRPPVIVVMGHVDHGKTKLLDAIRKTNVVEGEAGGITQHIGAYQVERKGKLITFIDTPGHEAFTAMRSRGAKVADIAILVVAADDGVKPQTVEAYHIIESAQLPMIVAINKIDKEGADVNRTKQELSNKLGIIPEDWGGKTICVPISALKGQGIEELLDMILLVADVESEHIKANPDARAIGTVIESHIDKGAGPVATILIQNGTLKVGDYLSYKGVNYGKVRALHDYQGRSIKQAGPAEPAKILGLKILPEVGDILEVSEGKKIKHKKLKALKKEPLIKVVSDDDKAKKINLIIKSDVLGSAEAIEESLAKISTDKVKVNIIHKGLGNITDGDIKRAEASNAIIVGFNVKLPHLVEDLAREKNIEVKLYQIIYDLINDIQKKMEEMVEPEYKRVDLGKVQIMAVFRKEPKMQIIGGKVIEGRAEIDSEVEIIRKNEFIDSGKITRLQSGKQDVSFVEEGQECGLQYEGDPVIQVGDVLHFYKKEKIN